MGCKEVKKETHSKPKLSNSIFASWQLFDVSNINTKAKNTDDELLKTAENKRRASEGIILSLFKDGSFTRLKGPAQYKTGSFIHVGDKLILKEMNSAVTDTFYATLLTVNNNAALNLITQNKDTTLQFINYAVALENYKEDPFYPANNLWRIHATKSETTQQIQDRLANYFKHLIYILKSSIERKQAVVSFEYSQGIVKIYNGGIGILDPNLVPKTWVDGYYNNKEAASAFKMFYNYLKTSHYKAAGIGDWMQDDYNILLSIYADIKEGKFKNDEIN
jgi:hypothetical protein